MMILFLNMMNLLQTTTKIQLSPNSYILSGKLPPDVIPDFQEMLCSKPTMPDTVIMAGKPILTPRFVAHYLKSYYYTGRLHEAKPLPDTLKPLFDWANAQEWKCELKNSNESKEAKPVVFNQVLVNYYMNGLHYIGKHSDDERQLTPGSPIFSASFGQERIFRIRNKKDSSIVKDIIMKDGTFLLMCGNMQKEFSHEVPKVMGNKGTSMKPRINVTFRMF